MSEWGEITRINQNKLMKEIIRKLLHKEELTIKEKDFLQKNKLIE